VIWGKYEASFDSSEPESYPRCAQCEVHIVMVSFVADTAAEDIAALIGQFMKKQK